MSSKLKPVLAFLLGVVITLAGWHITALLVNSPALPTPLDTVPVLLANLEVLLPHFAISTYRVVVAMVIGTALALPIGLWIGRNPKVDAVLGPTLYILYPIPKIVFLPVLLVLLGLADAPKIVLIAIAIFFQVIITVRDACKQVPEDLVESVRSLGASKLDIYRHVILPALLPDLFTALRISSGTAIAILFFAEAFAGSTGLGYFIMDSWAMINYPRMFAGIIAMAVLGVILYELFDLAERRLTRWRKAA
ncbi:MAG: ABC transporter permease [Coriobacteriia bacterium]|nr:ABC transporter permease [Coriobacteriia bacterium]